MSTVGVHRLVRDLERCPGAVDRLLQSPGKVMDEYPLTEAESAAILDLDAAALVELGVNPLVMRTLLVLCGVGNPEIYSHQHSLHG
jgi:hypothetical protein